MENGKFSNCENEFFVLVSKLIYFSMFRSVPIQRTICASNTNKERESNVAYNRWFPPTYIKHTASQWELHQDRETRIGNWWGEE